MIASARDAFDAWLQRRLPADDTRTLGQRNVYILPTKAGVAFAAVLLAMLLAAINYQLNLGYLLTFGLAGAALASMHMTHATLRGLTLHLRAPRPAHAGEPQMVEIVVTNPGRRARHGIALRWRTRGTNGFAWCEVDAGAQAAVHLGFVAPHRGWHALPAVVAETVFPFGLFRAWTVWRPASRALAWPRPETPPAPLPRSAGGPGDAPAAALADAGHEFDGVRGYRRGDPPRQIVWKKVARSGELVSRDARADGRRELWLDWADSAGAGDAERRLERIAGWLLACEHAGLAWGLRLPGFELAPAHGDSQRRAALDRMAQWR